MTNYEKYKAKLQEIVNANTNLAVDKRTGEPTNCAKIRCNDCGFCNPNRSCRNAMTIWLLSEYKEPPVDWSKVPVDTPILVKDDGWDSWVPRHFAKYEGGKVYAWSYGGTSYTACYPPFGNADECCTEWEMAKLYKEEQNE